MQFEIPNPEFDRVATLDIETTHYKPNLGEVVSVGVGVHDAGTATEQARYELFHRDEASVDNEVELIRRAVSYLDTCNADGLVTYNGVDFDLPFLCDRMYLNGAEKPVIPLDTAETHVDMMKVRKERCARTDEDWPSLEACLESYDLPVPKTTWGGSLLTNKRFGRELGPAYIDALGNGGVDDLKPVIEHYLQTDLEANFAVFYSDIGEAFEPWHLNTDAEF